MNKQTRNITALLFGPLLLLMGWTRPEEVQKTPIMNDEGGNPWNNAYQLESKHYSFRTDIPEPEARKYVENLEMLHQAFSGEFKGLLSPDKIKNKLVVYFFNDFSRYRVAVQKSHPERADSDGFYGSRDRVAHFYKIATKIPNPIVPDDETSYHECGHQLMDGLHEGTGWNSGKPHFWAVEGIGCYFETLSIKDGKGTLGQRHPKRFAMVKKNMAQVKQLSLSKYIQYTQKGMMSNGYVTYSMASALSYFLATADGGKYKKAFLQYAVKVNNGDVNANTFKEVFGFEIDTLQDKFRKFLDTL